MGKKVVYHSFDFDGCFSNEASAYRLGTKWSEKEIDEQANKNYKSKDEVDRAYLEANREIIESFKTGEETVLLVGSNRQNPEIDFGNGNSSFTMLYPTGSVFPRMEAIAKELGENTTFNPFLLLDLEFESVEIGKTYSEFNNKDYLNDNGSYKPTVTSNQFRVDGFPQQLDDESKVSLLFAQMKLAAMQNPDDDIEFNFYDDRKDIVEGLNKFLNDNPELIPKNVTLNIKAYSGPIPTPEQANSELNQFIMHTTASLDTDNPSPATKEAMELAQKNNCPILIKINGEGGDKFVIYRHNKEGNWDFADFDEKELDLNATEFSKKFPAEDGGRQFLQTFKNPEIHRSLEKLHFLPIPSGRPSNRGIEHYPYGKPIPFSPIRGEGSIPTAITDWKPVFQVMRQASTDPLLDASRKLSVAKHFTLARFISEGYANPKAAPGDGVQEFVDQKFIKMTNQEIADTLVDSKINGHSIKQILKDEQRQNKIIELVIAKKLSKLNDVELSIQERYEIESSLKGIEEHLPLEFTKMSADALATALSDSAMSGQAIVKLLKDDENKEQIINQVIDNKFSKLQGELTDEERQKIETSFNGMEPFITQKFAKMQRQGIVKLLNDSHMSGQIIVQLLKDTENKEQIISDLINKKRSILQGDLSEKKRTELEASLMELYKIRINGGLSQLNQEIKIEGLSNARQALHATISETLENPDLTLEDYQNIDEIIHHANIASDLQNRENFQSICRLGELADEVVGKKAERLSGVSAACAALAGVALIVAAVLAPTGIGLIVGLAVAAAFTGASIGTGIAAKRSESDLSKKTHAFKDALEAASAGTGIPAKKSESDLSKKTHAFKDALEDIREHDEEVKDTQLGQRTIQLPT
ncbi:Dot/Icm secretion system substrate [Legionella cherrii]|uniref:Dot/Icm secretion system substrate n=2 Tax=Legionella cherrii TaxID=28084 RepID=A0ABY6T239_9GAMM|nr:Dot/Icm secretion system substrate [Legionella cherrii]